MLFPTCEPLPSGPWHMAHFVRNVAALATLSGPRLARTTEETRGVTPKKNISINIEANITCRSVLSCVMALPVLAVFHSSSCGGGQHPLQDIYLERFLYEFPHGLLQVLKVRTGGVLTERSLTFPYFVEIEAPL